MLLLFAKLLHVFDGIDVCLQDVGDALWGGLHRTVHELRDVIALHQLAMVVGVFTWKLKWFRGVSVFVNMSNERSGEHSVGAAG